MHQTQALQAAVLGSTGMDVKEMSIVMLTRPSLPHRCRMTAIAQGSLITKYLVVGIQHTPARNLRGVNAAPGFSSCTRSQLEATFWRCWWQHKNHTPSERGWKSLRFSSSWGRHSCTRSSLCLFKVQPWALTTGYASATGGTRRVIFKDLWLYISHGPAEGSMNKVSGPFQKSDNIPWESYSVPRCCQ